MPDLLGLGTDRGYSMIGVGLSATLSGGRKARVNLDPMPALDLNFAANRSLPADYGPTPSFSRASTGTFFNSSGVLTSAAVNVPRFGHVYSGGSWVSRGLLVEEQRVNSCPYSNNHTVWGTAGATVSKSGTWLDGSANQANLLTISNTNNRHIVYNSVINSAANYVFSVYLKKGNSRYAHIQTSDDGTGNRYSIIFDFDTGTSTYQYNTGSPTGTGYSIVNSGGGWFRISLNITKTSSSYLSGTYGFSDSAIPTTFVFGSPSYTGNGTDIMYAGGGQFEAGSFATSYIENSSTGSTTRSADVCQISGSDFSSFWNASEGTVAAEFDRFTNSNTNALYSIFGSSESTDLIYQESNNGNESCRIYVGNVAQCLLSAGTLPQVGTVSKTVFGFKQNDFAASQNGAAVVTDTSGNLPTCTQMRIGAITTIAYNGHIARLRYYSTRLANATLQSFST